MANPAESGQEGVMPVAQRMSEAAYLEFVTSGLEGAWELHDGRLVEKPGMSWDHGRIVTRLLSWLDQLLAPAEFVDFTELRVRRPAATVFLPDIMAVPTSYGEPFQGRRGTLAIFTEPLPLVVEVWSASTGDYDVDTKIPVYMQRGDLETWRIHPYERMLTRWVRQPDGSYEETVHHDGTITPVALPTVAIDIARLFAG